MKMAKKLLAVVLAGVLALSVLTGCGGAVSAKTIAEAMSDVSKDWLEAERRIEEARASGVEKLDLSGLDIEMVPASVAGLEQVNWFQFLPHRRVVDVTALKQLPALQKAVSNTKCNRVNV